MSARQVRALSEAELPALVAAHPEPNAPENRHERRWRLQRQGDGVLLVAWDGPAPVGWVFALPPGSPEASPRARTLGCGELVDLQVEEAHRRRGHGRALLEAAEALARERGWPALGLGVTVANPWNEAARRLYAARGYGDAGVGTFDDGYHWWDDAGRRHWDGERHRYLVKRLG